MMIRRLFTSTRTIHIYTNGKILPDVEIKDYRVEINKDTNHLYQKIISSVIHIGIGGKVWCSWRTGHLVLSLMVNNRNN